MSREHYHLLSDVNYTGVYLLNAANDQRNGIILSSEGGCTVVGKKEHKVLEMLVSQPGEIVSSDEILSKIWPDFNRREGLCVLRNYIYLIRNRLRQVAEDLPEKLESVSGRGYRWSESSFITFDDHMYIPTDRNS